MDEVKRRPGRPKGSEIDDSAPLMAMARLLINHSKLPPKTAARRVFRSGSWGRTSEDASIHRWQAKWKASGATYLQRVQAERAEAERQQRAAAQTRQASIGHWETVAAQMTARTIPGLVAGSDAARAFLAQHDRLMAGLTVPSSLAKLYALTGSGLSVPGTIGDLRRIGADIDAALRVAGVFRVPPAFQEALRQIDPVGSTIGHIDVSAGIPKPPRGLG